MTAKELFQHCAGLEVYEQRQLSNEYAEIVFLSSQVEQWEKRLSEILDPPQKPAGVKPNKEDSYLTNDFGGVYDNQTLFKKDFAEAVVIAMFWPWQDNTHTTLKIAVLGK